jgi:hypothetical protein
VGVVKLLVVRPAALVCSRLPAVEASYHLKIPAVALLAAKVIAPDPQLEAAVTVDTNGSALIVAITAVRGLLSQLLAFLNVT